MYDEALLGFDIREVPGGLGLLWDAERRSLYLLKADAPYPLSVDALVWPSIFDTGQGIGLSRSERKRLHLAGLPVPSYTGPNVGLWEDIASMREYLNEQRIDNMSIVAIAISWVSDCGFSDKGEFGPYVAQTTPATINPDWEKLGFDIGDGSLISGLSNCGYLHEEVDTLRRQWGSRLNKHHLFHDLSHAFQFRDLSNGRVPAHAPFFVYGLYLAESIN